MVKLSGRSGGALLVRFRQSSSGEELLRSGKGRGCTLVVGVLEEGSSNRGLGRVGAEGLKVVLLGLSSNMLGLLGSVVDRLKEPPGSPRSEAINSLAFPKPSCNASVLASSRFNLSLSKVIV